MRLEHPSFTREYNPEEFNLPPESWYIRGAEINEPRTALKLLTSIDGGRDLLLTRVDEDQLELNDANGKHLATAFLHDDEGLRELLSVPNGQIFLDITAMEHRTWAPIVRSLVANEQDFQIIYRQPQHYSKASAPLPGGIWDLTHEIEGIAPLPGFISITPRQPEYIRFVPLLGFEGNRLEHMLIAEDIESESVVPIVGSPGFRAEYPVETVAANRAVLSNNFVFNRKEYATASCPFDLYFLLEHLRHRYDGDHFLIAPIGTKPHALGAVLQALRHPSTTELIYDHPRRRNNRTSGDGPICVYDVSAFAREYLSPNE